MHPLDPSRSSAQRKLARGIEHVKFLREEIDTFEHSSAYEARVERNIGSPQEIEHIVYAVERERPPPHWPLLVGEAVQNLRSALDHAVFERSKRGKGKSQFPIFVDPCEFQVKGRPRIGGVPIEIRALVEAAQPYKTFPSMPRRAPLAILADLSNADKHRTLSTLASLVRVPYVGYEADVNLEWTVPPLLHSPLHDGVEVTRFVVRATTEGADMNVDPRFIYEVGIEWRRQIIPLESNLTAIAKRVFEVVTEVETGQPLSPFATYPIY